MIVIPEWLWLAVMALMVLVWFAGGKKGKR